MKTRDEYTCPLQLTHDIIRGKWKPIVLWQLGKERTSLSALKREIKGISQKMLLEHLKDLQEFGMVDKEQYTGYPLKVEYFLTPRGERMLEVIVAMQKIGIELMQEDEIDEILKEKGQPKGSNKKVCNIQ